MYILLYQLILLWVSFVQWIWCYYLSFICTSHQLLLSLSSIYNISSYNLEFHGTISAVIMLSFTCTIYQMLLLFSFIVQYQLLLPWVPFVQHQLLLSLIPYTISARITLSFMEQYQLLLSWVSLYNISFYLWVAQCLSTVIDVYFTLSADITLIFICTIYQMLLPFSSCWDSFHNINCYYLEFYFTTSAVFIFEFHCTISLLPCVSLYNIGCYLVFHCIILTVITLSFTIQYQLLLSLSFIVQCKLI